MSERSAGTLNLIFLGPPGAGKGTQSRMVEEKYSIPQISTGDLMRKEISSGSSFGEEINGYIKLGGLVPDHIVISMLLHRLKGDDCKTGYILDGFPRTVEQAKSFGAALAEKGSFLSGVIAITVADEVLALRLGDRRVCKKCGATYHLFHNKPKLEGLCDNCGTELSRRRDDEPDVIANRIEVYHQQTAPLIEYYQNKNKLHIVDGNKKIDVIFQQICGIIDELS
ncbi:MAG: adenylate kinase [Candidatus Riflebacteria bacterium]|nr:adenylate kinase [Candidatus Riflebacteria bacterium]